MNKVVWLIGIGVLTGGLISGCGKCGIEMNTQYVIEGMAEGDYLGDMNLLDQREVDIDYDHEEEQLEVYSTAGYGDDGHLMLDDGQEWAIIVRKGDQIYPISPRKYNQQGDLEYKVYTEFTEEGNIFHVLIIHVQGAGIQIEDCYYDQESEQFISKQVYTTKGNVSVGEEYH